MYNFKSLGTNTNEIWMSVPDIQIKSIKTLKS